MGHMFFRLHIIHPLPLLINYFGFHYIDDFNFLVNDKGNASVTGHMLGENEVSYISGMLISPGFHLKCCSWDPFSLGSWREAQIYFPTSWYTCINSRGNSASLMYCKLVYCIKRYCNLKTCTQTQISYFSMLGKSLRESSQE